MTDPLARLSWRSDPPDRPGIWLVQRMTQGNYEDAIARDVDDELIAEMQADHADPSGHGYAPAWCEGDRCLPLLVEESARG